ncbi:hypothetical protein [Pseudomonas sp. 18175]|uniref:hypothetical protein n=1 Tax=Pseudomonas sp. 18175 TaxID=3390056 RepID=UPI003D23B5A8
MKRLTKRYLERLTLLLGLPVAFLSIVSVVVPPAWTWLKGDYSKLDITLAYSDFDRMEVLVTNVGNRAAIVTALMLETGTHKDPGTSLFQVPKKQKLIKAGEQVLVNASNGLLIPANVAELGDATDLPQKTCSVVVKYRQYNSKEESSKYTFDCYAVDDHAAMRIANLERAGVSIPWQHFVIGVDGGKHIPTVELFEWAKRQPLTKVEASD